MKLNREIRNDFRKVCKKYNIKLENLISAYKVSEGSDTSQMVSKYVSRRMLKYAIKSKNMRYNEWDFN